MNNIEFVKIAKDICDNQKTCYALGTFGQLKTNTLIDNKAKQLPNWYTQNRITKLKALDSSYKLFDCSGLVKAILWGYPNTIYTANGVPDLSADSIIKKCTKVSSDLSNIPIGAFMHMSGHCGIYEGNGNVIECTPSFANGVCRTKLNERKWLEYGLLPYITYNNVEIVERDTDAKTLSNFIKDLDTLLNKYR